MARTWLAASKNAEVRNRTGMRKLGWGGERVGRVTIKGEEEIVGCEGRGESLCSYFIGHTV